MSGDYKMLEINQPNSTYLKPENNIETVDKLIKEIDEMKKKYQKRLISPWIFCTFLDSIINILAIN